MKTTISILSFIVISALHSGAFAGASGNVDVSGFVPLPKEPPIPKDNPITSQKVKLGKMLFFEPRISKNGTVSCNSCHNVMGSGTDNRSFSMGFDGKLGGRSSPTVWNAAFMSVQFWDGRSKSLEDQAKGPMTNPVEMGMSNHDLVIKRISEIQGYVTSFQSAFPGPNPLTIENVAKAIATYERTLITPDSPFDLYLKGKKSAISAEALKGMKLVRSVGCISCHSGSNFAGPHLPEGTGFFQKFPLMPGSEYDSKYKLTEDLGRFMNTKNEADKHSFRVPTWRNVALTAPYFHNGSVASLDEAVRVMAKTQLGKTLEKDEVENIVAFLNSLTGRFPEQIMPRLPEVANVSGLED